MTTAAVLAKKQVQATWPSWPARGGVRAPFHFVHAKGQPTERKSLLPSTARTAIGRAASGIRRPLSKHRNILTKRTISQMLSLLPFSPDSAIH